MWQDDEWGLGSFAGTASDSLMERVAGDGEDERGGGSCTQPHTWPAATEDPNGRVAGNTPTETVPTNCTAATVNQKVDSQERRVRLSLFFAAGEGTVTPGTLHETKKEQTPRCVAGASQREEKKDIDQCFVQEGGGPGGYNNGKEGYQNGKERRSGVVRTTL